MKIRTGFLTFLTIIFLAAAISAKDTWIEVTSENFHLVGNASEKEIKDVATRLEQFRHIFGMLFPKIKLGDSIETNVVVFKSLNSYTPFLPKRSDGTPDKGIAGLFLGAEDANYITLSVSSGDGDGVFEIIFHEYIHYLLKSNFERSDVPPWLDEGLAEYYSTFEVAKDQKAMLGNLRNDHLYYLSNNDLIPLKEFLAIDNYSLHNQGNHSRSMFYAQAWALVHYFAVKNEANKLTQFMDYSKTMAPEAAFKKALGYSYDEMEKILKKYSKQRKFTRLVASFNKKFDFEKDVTVVPLTEAESLAYLGDLLYRQQEYWTAEGYLTRSLEAEPDGVRANMAMGMVKMRLKQYDDAHKYLEKSISSESSGYFAHYTYAYALSREGMSGGGYVLAYKKETAEKIRRSVKKAIELKPDFVPAYNLAAFVNIVLGEDLEQAVTYLRKALSLKPGNEQATVNLSQALLRLKKYDDAEKLANGLVSSSDQESVRQSAKMILDAVKRYREFEARSNGNDGSGPRVGGIGTGLVKLPGKELTKEEAEKIRLEQRISSMNRNLPELADGQQRVVGNIEKIGCNGNIVSYRVKSSDGKSFNFRSDGFQGLELLALTDLTEDESVGCNFSSNSVRAVFNYTPLKSKTITGTLRAIVFVPDDFRIKSKEEMINDSSVIVYRSSENEEGQAFEVKGGTNDEKAAAREKREGEMRLAQLRAGLRKPREGEKRIVGAIEEVRCGSRGFGVLFKSGDGRQMFWTKTPEAMHLISFGARFEQSWLACGGTPTESLVVLTYVPSGGDLSTAGSIVSMEFVSEDPKIVK